MENKCSRTQITEHLSWLALKEPCHSLCFSFWLNSMSLETSELSHKKRRSCIKEEKGSRNVCDWWNTCEMQAPGEYYSVSKLVPSESFPLSCLPAMWNGEQHNDINKDQVSKSGPSLLWNFAFTLFLVKLLKNQLIFLVFTFYRLIHFLNPLPSNFCNYHCTTIFLAQVTSYIPPATSNDQVLHTLLGYPSLSLSDLIQS